MQRDGIRKTRFLDTLPLQVCQLSKFLQCTNQNDANGTVAYSRLYIFFEKLRIVEGTCKSEKRLYNEKHYPNGFGLMKVDAVRFESTYRLDDDDNVNDDGNKSDRRSPAKKRKSKIGAKVDGLRLITQISQLQYEHESDYIYDSYLDLIKKVRRRGETKRKRRKKNGFFL